jgi:selenocysteine-specific elongation factor
LGHRGARQHFAELLEHLVKVDAPGAPLHLRPDAVRAGALQRQLSEADQKLLDALESRLREGGLSPPTPAEIEKDLRAANRFTGFVRVLEAEGRLVRLSDALMYHPTALADVEARLRTFLASHDVMSMADFKELTGLSRKFAVPLLEYFDRKGVTRRDGDVRRRGPLTRA